VAEAQRGELMFVQFMIMIKRWTKEEI